MAPSRVEKIEKRAKKEQLSLNVIANFETGVSIPNPIMKIFREMDPCSSWKIAFQRTFTIRFVED